LEVGKLVSDMRVQNSREIGKNEEVGRTANVEVKKTERNRVGNPCAKARGTETRVSSVIE